MTATTTRRLAVIFSVVALDAVGIGLIFPILPALLRSITGSTDVSFRYGVVLALYALMQLVFSPVLGALSDRYGRRPVLLASIAGATVDYLLMAFSPAFSVLLVGRAIAGITSANMAVATAYIADVTTEDARAARFGQMSASFGVGFIVGPILGGVLGDHWVRAPFVAAAILNAANLGLVFWLLPESRAPGARTPLRLRELNPIAPLRWAFGVKTLAPVLGMFALSGLAGNFPGTVWVLYCQDRFHWDGLTVGLSYALFGACYVGAQATLTGPISARLGPMRTVALGVAFEVSAFVTVALATKGWVLFASSPLFALGGLTQPALQTMAAKDAGADKQGELQGVIASTMSLMAIVGPLVATTLYAETKAVAIGAVWFVGVALYVGAIPLLWARTRATRSA